MKIAALLLLCLLSACNSSPQNTELVGANVDFVDSYSLPTPAPRPIYSSIPSQEAPSENPRFDKSNRPVAYASPPFGGRVPPDKMVVDTALECLENVKNSLSKNKKEEIKVELIYPIQQKLSTNPSDEYWQYKVDVKNNYSEVEPGYESKPTITVFVIYSERKKEFMPSCYSGAVVKKIEASPKPKSSATPKPIKTAIPFTDLPVLGLTTKY